MTIQVNVGEAKTQLSQLLARVSRGEEVVIAKSGTPIARLTSMNAATGRELGFVDVAIPDEFWLPLPDDELDRWS